MERKNFVYDLFCIRYYNSVDLLFHSLRRNIFALTCDPKCDGEKKRGKIYSMGKKKKKEKK